MKIKPTKVIKLIKIAIAAFAMGDRALGLDQTLKAVAIMRANSDDFPAWSASDESKAVDISHSDTPIFSMF